MSLRSTFVKSQDAYITDHFEESKVDMKKEASTAKIASQVKSGVLSIALNCMYYACITGHTHRPTGTVIDISFSTTNPQLMKHAS